MESISSERDPTLEQGKSVRRKEQQRHDELTTNPHCSPPCTTGREEVEKSGVKLSLGRERWGEGVFKF